MLWNPHRHFAQQQQPHVTYAVSSTNPNHTPTPAIMKKMNSVAAKTSTHTFIQLLATVITNFRVKQRKSKEEALEIIPLLEGAWGTKRRSSVATCIFSLPDLQQNCWLEKETTRWEMTWQCSLYAADHRVWPHHSRLSLVATCYLINYLNILTWNMTITNNFEGN